jgi:RNA polymerase sigma-70 factor, ECF subfamily
MDTSQDDWALMQRVAAGDEEAVATLYDRFGSLVFRAARQVLSSRAEADDAVQEIFVRLWRSADRYDPRRAKLVTWVMLISRRYLIDALRRVTSRPQPGVIDEDVWVESRNAENAVPSKVSTDDESRRKLIEQLALLPSLQRTVIQKAYFEGLTLREVSEQIGAPLGTVKSALSRGLLKLRERVKSDQALR